MCPALEMKNEVENANTVSVKPFLKWAGGKKQLLEEFDQRYPKELKSNEIFNYIEPFIGGGAVFFHIIQKFNLKQCHIFDSNEELILTYKVIKNNVDDLIDILKPLENKYLSLDLKEKKIFYYDIRDKFNTNRNDTKFNVYEYNWIERAAQFIFLNNTCYNGLFRVNSKGDFNVPIGSYKNPKKFDEKNLRNISILLKNTEIHLGDFSESISLVDKHTFVYFDPPYRPLNKTSSFTSYSKNCFNEEDQIRLSNFYKLLDKKGAKMMLSNSDPKNENSDDDFFDELYSNFNIERVKAIRKINCNGNQRGSIDELIITNYKC